MPLFNLALIAVFAVCAVLSAIFCFERIWCVLRKPQLIAPYLPDRIRLSPAYRIVLPIFLILDVGVAAGWAFVVFASMAFIARLGMA